MSAEKFIFIYFFAVKVDGYDVKPGICLYENPCTDSWVDVTSVNFNSKKDWRLNFRLTRYITIFLMNIRRFQICKIPNPRIATLSKLVHCIYLWALQASIVQASTQLGVSQQTLVDLYNFLREVCSAALLQNQVLLGGPGRIVQIDESMFAHKFKHHRGRAPQSDVWAYIWILKETHVWGGAYTWTMIQVYDSMDVGGAYTWIDPTFLVYIDEFKFRVRKFCLSQHSHSLLLGVYASIVK